MIQVEDINSNTDGNISGIKHALSNLSNEVHDHINAVNPLLTKFAQTSEVQEFLDK